MIKRKEMTDIKEAILAGIPSIIPPKKEYDRSVAMLQKEKTYLLQKKRNLL